MEARLGGVEGQRTSGEKVRVTLKVALMEGATQSLLPFHVVREHSLEAANVVILSTCITA